MMTEKPYQRQQMNPALQFVVFLALTVGLIIVGQLLGLAAAYIFYGSDAVKQILHMNISTPQATHALWAIQLLGTTLPIGLIPVLFALIVKEPNAYLKTNINFRPILLMAVLLIMVASTPILQVLINFNQRMVLPQWLKGLEDWMRSSEQMAQKAMMAMLQMNTVWDCIVNVLLIGLLTAFVEELMFRGCLQTILVRWTKSTHAAIWITAALFSAFHMEFFGFLPRLMLGVLFGYFAAWSGSIWPAVWAHFINNGTDVVLVYLYQHKKLAGNPDSPYVFNYSWYILSVLITVALLYAYRAIALNKHQAYLH
ncbi:CPBP family intramembrane metalloprotease [Mucilaginibacter robiniae]|uniref:CPBP family intramembrane metalloprotease n=1 Tax=Mucilaginibacter robiniae TaxID=2728022 RepID=A0A7L5E7J6_9SPHI|nr:CPBP family intramembrane glutamic endopeptidase [Mucilaginibacter robiniae]QJD96346.1 CPBP family intramembrane metalloprotease [Mucilaginibacter robiniae]